MQKVLLIDGFNLAYRCFFAVPELTRADGFPTNALHGWVKSVWRLTDQENPAHTFVFFDLGGSQERLAIHPEYKAQRADMPEALQKQIEPIKAITRAMGYPAIEQRGIESDDLLASQAVGMAKKGYKVVIVSADKDFLQIVNENIKVMLPPPSANPKMGWRLIDASGVLQKFGVLPNQIADYLALVGDASDNIPGLVGVGPKTAAKWLKQFTNIEKIIAHVDQIQPERFREIITSSIGILRRNLKLTTLDLSLPQVAIPTAAFNPKDLFTLFEEMEMKSSLAEAIKRCHQPELSF